MGEEIQLTSSLNTKQAPSYSPSTSSISGIMQKALRFSLKNKKLMLRVLLLVLLPFLILVLLHSLIAIPLIAKVEDGLENSTLDHQDLISLVVIEIPFVLAFCLLLLFASAITIFASISAHQGASVGLRETLFSIKSTWKKILVSGLYISVLMTVFFGITIILTQLTALIGVISALTYPYLASISTLVLVISAVEDEYQGKRSFRLATEIIRQGGFQGYFLMLILLLLSIPVYVLFYVTSTDDDDENGLITQFSFLLVATVLFCVTSTFNNVAFMLFYLEYKQRNDEKIEVLQAQYHPVPTSTTTEG